MMGGSVLVAGVKESEAAGLDSDGDAGADAALAGSGVSEREHATDTIAHTEN